MRLSLLLEAVKEYKYTGNPDPDITGLNYDSRKIRPGELFVAVKGNTLDGHKFIQKAIDNGAKAVLVEEDVTPPPGISMIKVSDTRREMSRLAARFYEYPFNSMNVTGVTGTSGKTTVTYMIESILVAAGEKPGVIGTVNTRFMDRITPSSVTTPESLDLMRIARDMADRGVESLVMEVSSHAIHQKRTIDLPFRTVVFTNLSRDHLDYHATLEDYFETKSRLFKNLPVMVNGKKSCAVINMDDPKGWELCKLTKALILTYGLNGAWDIRAENIRADLNGLSAELITPYGSTALRSPLLGEINIYNILAAAGAALASGISPDKISEGIASLKSVPGRLERVPNRAGLSIIVDYSHKPDALLKVLTSLRPFVKKRLIAVFGCGGDRDKGKRYEMGLIAGRNSDAVILTSDNPRTEDPEEIISQIEKGILDSGMKMTHETQLEKGTYLIEADRRLAIKRAVSIAEVNDVILIAGKGHEDYQITGTTRRPFDDREEAVKAVNAL